MQKKQLILPLMILMLLFGAGSTVYAAATGNVNELCSAVSDDLSAAGGCIDDDDFEDTITSTGGLFVLEGGDKAGLLVLFLVMAFIVSVITVAIVKSKQAAKR